MALTKVSTPAIKDEAITLAKLLHGDSNNDGKFLRANNGADPSFETVSIPAGTTINNNADNRVITGSGTANTLNAESNVIIDSSGRLLAGTTTQNNNAQLQVSTNQQVVASFEGTGVSDPQIYLGDDMSSPTDNCIILGYDKADNRGYLTVGGDADNVFTVKNGGDIEIGVGNLKFGASGKGIDFSATADGSGTSTSELLADYEVGTWTPAFSGLSNTPTFAGLQGKYVKVGNIVYLSAWMQAGGTLPTFTTVGDPLKITGIPYTANGTGYTHAHGVVSWSQMDPWGSSYNETPHGDTTGHILVGIPDGTNIVFYVSGANNTNRGRVTNNALHNSGFILEWSITYQTNS